MTIKKLFYIFLFTFAVIPVKSQTWSLVWSEEFNVNGAPNAANWLYEIHAPGWVNNELQSYTNSASNSYVQGGNLVITTICPNPTSQTPSYTSARINSTNSWTYGRFEISAKLPKGRGMWPAIWMLYSNGTYGNGGWPDNGELDIMEEVGYDQGVIHGSAHCNLRNTGNPYTGTLPVSDCSDAFHVYAMEWSADKIDMFVDQTKYMTVYNNGSGWQQWPWNTPFHFILNIAVGGSWGGLQGVDNTVFPQSMLIDYVRVYKDVSAVSEINNDLINSIKLYPNPSKDSFNVQLNNTLSCKSVKIVVFSVGGKQVLSKEFKNVTEPMDINFADYKLAAGMYMVNIITDKGTVNKKLIIK